MFSECFFVLEYSRLLEIFLGRLFNLGHLILRMQNLMLLKVQRVGCIVLAVAALD